MTFIELIGLALLVAVVLMIALVAIRRLLLARSGGIDVAWRKDLRSGGGGWILGQARYLGDNLQLFRSFSPLPVAARELNRHSLVLGNRRAAEGTEPDLLPASSVIVRCTDHGNDLELALSQDALTGLRSWLESAPSVSRGGLPGDSSY